MAKLTELDIESRTAVDVLANPPVLSKTQSPEKLLKEAREAARTYQKLCVCYRLGKTPSEALFKRLDKAREAIARWDSEEKQ